MWKTKRKGKQCQNAGGGNTKQPPPNLNPQEVEQEDRPQNLWHKEEAIKNLVELVDTRLEEATKEEWSTFMNALKIVQVDRAQDPQGRKDHAKM